MREGSAGAREASAVAHLIDIRHGCHHLFQLLNFSPESPSLIPPLLIARRGALWCDRRPREARAACCRRDRRRRRSRACLAGTVPASRGCVQFPMEEPPKSVKHVNPIPDWAAAAPVTWVLRNAARDGLQDVVASQLQLGCPVNSPDVVRGSAQISTSRLLARRPRDSRATAALRPHTARAAAAVRSEWPHAAVARGGGGAHGGGAGAARGGRRD